MPHVKKPTIQHPALQELYLALPKNNSNLTTPFAFFTSPLPFPPPDPLTALPILLANLIKDTLILLAINYVD